MTEPKSYIDNRSYEQFVDAAKPTGAYDSKVFMIHSDFQRRGEFKLYQDKYEYYENEKNIIKSKIETLEKEIKTLKSKIDSNRDLIEEYTNKISQSKSDADKKEIKLLTDKIPKLEQSINDAIEELPEMETELKDLNKKLSDHEWMEFAGRSEYYSLYRARNEYFQTKDIEYLRKAVHAICSYADSLRYGSKYVAPYKGNPLDVKTSPFSEDVTLRLNKQSDYEWFKDGKLIEDW
jgi:cell division protein FtsB